MRAHADLQSELATLESDPRIREICRRRLLCRTIAGNRCDVLTISGNAANVDFKDEALRARALQERDGTGGGGDGGVKTCASLSSSTREGETVSGTSALGKGEVCGVKHGEEPKKKPCVVLSARVHPGETNASWMMKGCIDFLLGDSLG